MSIASPSPFKLVGGHRVADFVNTVGGWRSRPDRRGPDWADVPAREKLDGFPALVRWSEQTGLVPAAVARQLRRTPAAIGAAALRRAHDLRAAVYRLLRARSEHWSPRPADLALLADLAREARAHQHLGLDHGRPVWQWEGSPPDRVTWALALEAVDLLGSDDADRIGRCPGMECGWLFVDRSRNRSRRWCDMADCGNTAKVRRFRRQAARGAA